MTGSMRSVSSWVFVVGAALAIWSLGSPVRIVAQNQGNNAVYYQSGSAGACCKGSGAFVDASMFTSQGVTVCAIVNYVLTHAYPSAGAVIDARGLNSSNTSMTCTTAKPSPWAGIPNPPPSTILLPATSAAKLILNTSGSIYGTTQEGGIESNGTVFEVSP